jgi:signal transduction histidine kinase
MRRRILVAILSVASIAVILFGVPLAIVVERSVEQNATLRVERQAILAARDVPADFATSDDPVELAQNTNGIALALYDPAGALIAGRGPSVADPTTRQALRNEVVDTEASNQLVVAVPVAANERVIGAIRAEQSTSAADTRTRKIIALLGALTVGVLGVGAAIGYVVAGRLARPVRRLRDAAVQLGDGDFTIEVPRSSVPELDQAGQAMTATARRLDEMVTRERAFSTDASHQLRTPLAGLRAAIETELQFPRIDRTDVLHEAIVDIDRLERTIADMVTIARGPGQNSVTASVSLVLDEIDAAWRGRLAAVGRPLRIADASELPAVSGNASMLRHALDVLLDNALTHGGGEVRVDHALAAETITLSVADDGGRRDSSPVRDGAAMTDVPHGLGLPMARRLIEALPGRLSIRPSPESWHADVVLRRADAGQH